MPPYFASLSCHCRSTLPQHFNFNKSPTFLLGNEPTALRDGFVGFVVLNIFDATNAVGFGQNVWAVVVTLADANPQPTIDRWMQAVEQLRTTLLEDIALP